MWLKPLSGHLLSIRNTFRMSPRVPKKRGVYKTGVTGGSLQNVRVGRDPEQPLLPLVRDATLTNVYSHHGLFCIASFGSRSCTDIGFFLPLSQVRGGS